MSSVRLRAVSPVARSSRRARSANETAPIASNISWATRSCSRASIRRFSRRSHSPYTRWAREVRPRRGPTEPFDCLQVGTLGLRTFVQQGARACLRPKPPVGPAELRSLRKLIESRKCLRPLSAANASLDQLAQPVTKHLERVVLRRALRGKKRSLVAADAVVQKRACELDVDHRPSSTTDRSLAAFDLFER